MTTKSPLRLLSITSPCQRLPFPPIIVHWTPHANRAPTRRAIHARAGPQTPHILRSVPAVSELIVVAIRQTTIREPRRRLANLDKVVVPSEHFAGLGFGKEFGGSEEVAEGRDCGEVLVIVKSGWWEEAIATYEDYLPRDPLRSGGKGTLSPSITITYIG